MSVKRQGLGRNLSALLNHSAPIDKQLTADNPSRLSVTDLQPGRFQPRGAIDESSLQELVESIKQQGVLQPLIVRTVAEHRYEIIAGERRWRASQLAGLQQVPVIIREVDDETAMAIALIENLQREDLNPLDEARAILRLTQEFSLTHEQIATLLSKSRTAISNALRLLNLHAHVKRLLENGDIDMGHARALLSLSESQQQEVANLVVAKHLSVRETEALVARVKKQPAALQQAKIVQALEPGLEALLHDLAHSWQTKVKLKPGKAGQGTLQIRYQNEDNLKQLLQRLAMTD